VKRLRLLAISLVVIFIAACSKHAPVNNVTLLQIQERSNNTWNKHKIDSCINLLKTGDLVVRTGIEVSSYMLSQMNLYNKTYSHSGLVVIEHGYPFVYHSIGGEDNPNACLRRDSAKFFFSPANNFGFGFARYDIKDSAKQKLVQTIYRFYREKRKFDMNFDLKTDDRLYCAEFVYKAILQATGDNNYIKTVSAFGYTYVGVDNLFMNPHCRMICEVKFK
jgi:hypothetical protein